MNSAHRQVFLRGESNPNLYFSTGRKVPKAHRGGQSVHEGVAAPDPPPYPNTLRAHCRGAALISPRGGGVSSLGEALARHTVGAAAYPPFSGVGAVAQTGGISCLRVRRGRFPCFILACEDCLPLFGEKWAKKGRDAPFGTRHAPCIEVCHTGIILWEKAVHPPLLHQHDFLWRRCLCA